MRRVLLHIACDSYTCQYIMYNGGSMHVTQLKGYMLCHKVLSNKPGYEIIDIVLQLVTQLLGPQSSLT